MLANRAFWQSASVCSRSVSLASLGQTRGGATVSFDHNLVLKIEKLTIGNMQRAKIIALVRTGIHKPCDSSRESGKLGPRGQTRVSAF
jgi:hypothetical protein